MSDLISRQAVLDELEKWDWQDLYLPIHFKQILDDVPSVENKGEWKYRKNGWMRGGFSNGELYKWKCSKCKDVAKWAYSFCPFCGADMRGKAEGR